MSLLIKSPPPNWASDRFTEFLENVRGNQFATFVRKPMVAHLIEIDACFLRIEEGWINPRPMFPTLFMYRSHGVYRAALCAAMAGQIFEVFPLLRSCLECAAYGLHIGNDDVKAESWLRRHDNASLKEKMKREFASAKLRATIKSHGDKMLAVFDEMYERTIDFGGHPNERGLLGTMTLDHAEDRTEHNTIFLHGDGLPLDHALKTTGQVGLWSLFAFQLVYPERFMLLGVKERVDALRKHF